MTISSLVILAIVALGFALKYTRAVMIPFVFSIFFVSIVSPFMDFLILKLRFPRVIAVMASLFLVVVFITGISIMMYSALSTVVQTIGRYRTNVEQMAYDVYDRYHELRHRFDWQKKQDVAPVETNEPESPPVPDHDVLDDFYSGPIVLEGTSSGLVERPNMPVEVKKKSGSPKEEAPPQVTVASKPLDFNQLIKQVTQNLLNLVRSAMDKVMQFLIGTALVIIFVIFMLFGRNPRMVSAGVYADIDQKIRRYTITKLGISAATGILVWISLRLLELQLAEVFGTLAFVLNFIPSIGSIISTMLPIPVAVAQFPDQPLMMVLCVAVPGMVQIIMGNVIEPKLMGEGLSLHPVTILMALSFWGMLWGVAGMFLAAPLAAVIRITFLQFDTLRPVGEIMAGKLPEGWNKMKE